jgi:NADH-quinone oxidoreductase subunit F
MSKPNQGAEPIAATGCWLPPTLPSPELLAALKAGPFSRAGKDRQAAAELVARLRRERLERPSIFVGAGTCGLGAGAEKTIAAIQAWLTSQGCAADLIRVGCVGLCSEEPVVDIQLPGRARVSFGPVMADAAPALLDAVILQGRIPSEGLLGQYEVAGLTPWAEVPRLADHPFLKPQLRWVLAGSGIIDPDNLDEYIARGGYSAAYATLHEHTPDAVCDIVERSGLRGRGGGGFPTGRKWKLARAAGGEHKYLICNADEGDPGAFMDRAVCESDPHRLLEGILIAAYGIGAKESIIYIRAEYPLAVQRLKDAIAQAEVYGLLGEHILGSDFSLKVKIKMGAGAFVCGEETALIHSIEGKRGMPRPRPPYPAAQGLFGRPTIINNVETLANLSTVMRLGWEGFSAVGTEGSKGTKVYALSGMVARTGLVEVPMGTPIRDVVFTVGGGVPGGRRCKAVQIGGPSGGCIPEAHLDLPTDYEALKKFGAIMGSGGLVVMDENTCMVDLAKYFMEFIQSESCGKCIPCREGTRRMLEILQAITRSYQHENENEALLRFQGIMQLQQLARVIKDSSLCGLGQTAPNPVLSTLRWFRDEYEAHIYERRCPAGSCRDLVGAPCQTGCPVGTEVWRYVAHIARGENEEAYRAIRRANPFPSVCARVCNHPCEAVCRAGTTGGDPVAVRSLKRYVVDRVDPRVYTAPVKPAAPDAPRIAVIGAGPAGLTAAHLLAVQGMRVTIYEQEKRPGGMLTSAIPAYRLPRDILDREIEALLNENIDLRLDSALGRDFTVDGLLAEGFKAVYLAIGAHESLRLGVPGEDVEGVVPGIRFLKAYNLEGKCLAKGRVGIIGGGNSALDAARAARRMPEVTAVTVFYRRSRDEMPAYAEEIEAALAEGVVIEPLTAPVEVLSSQGLLSGMRFLHTVLGDPDTSGRRRPEPVPGSEFDVPLDTLIVAISERPETTALADLEMTRWGTPRINEESCLTSQRGVFAGGDVTTGPGTVIGAIAAGKRAAMMIGRFVQGKQLRVLPHVALPDIYLAPVGAEDGDEAESGQRVHPPLAPVASRVCGFSEVELSIDDAQAHREARRCLRCDLEFTQPK